MTLQIVRDWVMKFNAHGPEGLIDCKPPGQPSGLNGAHRAALAAILESGPIPGRAWRRALADRRPLPMDLRGIPRRRRQADIEPGIARHGISCKLSARPRHHSEQAEGAIENFKKAFPRAWTRSGARRAIEPAAIEVWFADEARIGQRTKITRRWAKRGTRQARRRTSEPPRLISSARSAPSTERVQPSSCPDATRRP